MLQTYSYNKQAENFNDIIDTVIDHVGQNMEKKFAADYKEDVKNLNAVIVRYCLEGTRYAEKYAEHVLDAVKDPRVKRDATFKDNFNAVIAEVIVAAAPMVSAPKYTDALAEVVQVGFGDTARFVANSNALFKVNEIAEGVQRGVLQPIYNDEYTVNATPVEIATAINWYQVAAGTFDWGLFGLRAGKSFESYIFLKIIAAMTSAAALVGAGYSASGMSDANWDSLSERVRAANAGADVYAIGTVSALSQVIPANNYLQMGLGEEVAKEGALSRYHGTPLIIIPNVLKPMTINSTADLAIPATKIYFVGADTYRPVKVVFEGDSVIVEENAFEMGNADRTYQIKIEYRIGISAIVGSKFGTLTLA